jgi:hypothetical protein
MNFFCLTKNKTALKKFTFKAMATLLMVASITNINAQVKPGAETSKLVRCATMEVYEQKLKADPTIPARSRAAADRLYNEWLRNAENGPVSNGTESPTGTSAITYIPIVFHVNLTAAQHVTVTDALIQRQVDVLNRDYGGLNPDSVKIPAAFKAVFGHSELRFILAKRTPGGASTNGIERLTSANTFSTATYPQMKHASSGGMDQWDGNKYFNVWVGQLTGGLLGVATFPNDASTPANEQGVSIHWGSIDLPCGSPFVGAFDGGRTLVHEAGHYFYLYHIWGDDGNACTGSDFREGFGTLPASCTDDTPNQAGASAGCLSGVRTDACSPNPPGFMYQNYMDYTDDPCYGMFTIGQNCRAQACVDLYRAGLKTSDGATPVGTPINNDARISEILNPASRGFGCTPQTNTNFCSAFTPQVLIVNDGDANLTSLSLDSKVDGVSTGTPTAWTGTLVPGASAYITLNSVNSTAGGHTLTVDANSPNGGVDARPTNNSMQARFTMTSSTATNFPLPLEGFESTTFPPPGGWSVFNQAGDAFTWVRTVAAAKTGVASAFINHYAYTTQGRIDILQSPKMNTSTSDIVTVDFDVAYAPFSATLFERLEVVYSTDCGATWLPTSYDKSGLTLSTTGAAVTAPFTPTAAQWRHETVSILLGCGPATPAIVVGLRATNGYGNNLYVDNVGITSTGAAANNLAANTLAGIPSLVCPAASGNGVINPTFSFRNLGASAVTTATIMAKIDALPAAPVTPVGNPWTGNLAKCAVATVALGNITIPGGGGNHTIKIYTINPNNLPDLVPSNDTITQTFYVQESLTLPYTYGWEPTTFPPAGGWRVQNPDAGITWARSTAAARTGVGSMFMNYYAYAGAGQIDIISTPIVPLAGLDSLTFSWDYAYAPFSATLNDTLEVMYSANCGATWLPTGWRKGGVQLATNGGAFVGTAFVPTAAQWKTETLKLSTCNIPAPNVMYAFVSKNGYGNQLYIDNLNITGVAAYTVNAATLNIIDPPAALCTTNFTPRVTIGNFSAASLTSVTINYQVDGGTPVAFNWTGNLARCSTTVVTLNPVTSVAGNHILTVYTTNPNGTADQFRPNDTARKAFSISPTVATPQVEGFEGSVFPPTNWSVQNPDGLVTWTRATTAARTGTASMVIRNFDQTTANTTDMFYSPVIINNASIDSQFVAFDYAYVQGNQYPGSTVRPLDTLELMITQDCGATFKTIWKNYGDQLQTVSDPNYVYTAAYTPTTSGEWRNIKLFLNPFIGTSNYQVYWVAKSNRQNNLYIDNINISSKTLPQKLKNQGFDIYPNPFSSSFLIHHWVAPMDLQAAQVYTSAGQLVWDKRFSGNANTEITVNMAAMAKGVYVLKMIYSNKTVVERIVKN